MNINISNYGARFLDYHEGVLTAERVAELFLFLEQHPELREEFDSFSIVNVDIPETVFPFKENLKKEIISASNINDFLIADLEGDLNLQERIMLGDFLKKNPEYIKDKELFGLTRLQAGDEFYEGKKDLKIKIINPFAQRLKALTAAAAIIIMLFVLYINDRDSAPVTADVNPKKESTLPSVSESSPKTESRSALTANGDGITNDAVKGSQGKSEKKPVLPDERQRNFIAQKPVEKKQFQNHKELKSVAREDIMLAERKDVKRIETSMMHEQPIALQIASAPPAFNNSKAVEASTFNGKIAGIKDRAAEKINSTTGEKLLYTSDEIADDYAEKMPFKSRLLKFVSWSVAKISGDKLRMDPEFDASGNVASYQVSAGKFKYERDF